MFSPGLDGNQVLDFYWTDPIDAMKRSVSKLQYKDKLYTTFKPGMSITEPMVRAFDEANSGMVFQHGCHPGTVTCVAGLEKKQF